MDDILQALRGAGEPTRLRIMAILARCELSVGELCRILGQSQPRVSRHLRLLTEAGLLERHAEGVNAYYRVASAGVGAELARSVLGLIGSDDPTVRHDLERLDEVKAARADAAAAYFAAVADEWDEVRGLHVDELEIEAALLGLVGDEPVRQLLDIGTGTGRMLELFADRIELGLGVDLSPRMLGVARSRLDEESLAHCLVRQADVYDLRHLFDDASFDLAIIHQVLHFLDDPGRAVVEAANALRPGGRLLIIDFAPHDQVHLRTEFAHQWLGLADHQVATWCELAGLTVPDVTVLPPPEDGGALTTSMWVARRPDSAPVVHADPAHQEMSV